MPGLGKEQVILLIKVVCPPGGSGQIVYPRLHPRPMAGDGNDGSISQKYTPEQWYQLPNTITFSHRALPCSGPGSVLGYTVAMTHQILH